MRLEFHPDAEVELIEAAVHYELQVPGLGRHLEAEIRRAIDLLLEHPEIGPPVDPNFTQVRSRAGPLHPHLLRDIRSVAHRGCRPSKSVAGLLEVEN